MAIPLKRTTSSPPNKDGKKHKDDECIVCNTPATECVMECIWCEARLHAKCAKLSDEQCILIGNASRNVVFFCSDCLEVLPTAFKSYDICSFVDAGNSSIEKAIKDAHTTTFQGLKSELTTLQSITTNLATKVKDLCTQNNTLQEQLQAVSSDLTSKSTSSTTVSEVALSTFDVADEIAERDRRKRNVIIYNLPEQANRAGDKTKFTEVCKSIIDRDIDVVKLFRLGRKIDNKYRPLLVGLSSEADKQNLLSAAPHLRSSKEFKQVYINTDMTKLEREKHRKVVAELKRRRSSGESNLIIRNGTIVSRRSPPDTMQVNSEAVHSSAQTSEGPSDQSS